MKNKTYDQVVAMKKKAVRFVQDVLSDPDRADEIEDESVEGYAERKKISLTENPNRGGIMDSMTKVELEQVLGDAGDLLEQALDPKLERGQVVELVEQALDAIDGDLDDEEGEELEENPE